MARRYRRKTFWRQAQGETITVEAASFGTPQVEQLDGINSDASLSLYTRDAVPTLVAIVGTIIVTAARDTLGTPSTPNTEAGVYGIGIQCVPNMGIDIAVDPLSELEDEMWLWTTAGRIDATSQAQVIWNTQTNAEVVRYATNHVAPYPHNIPVRSKAKRKFEDPCSLYIHFNWTTPGGLTPFEEATCRWYLRTLWKAS